MLKRKRNLDALAGSLEKPLAAYLLRRKPRRKPRPRVTRVTRLARLEYFPAFSGGAMASPHLRQSGERGPLCSQSSSLGYRRVVPQRLRLRSRPCRFVCSREWKRTIALWVNKVKRMAWKPEVVSAACVTASLNGAAVPPALG